MRFAPVRFSTVRLVPAALSLTIAALSLSACVDVRSAPTASAAQPVSRSTVQRSTVQTVGTSGGQIEGASIVELRRAPGQVVQSSGSEAAAALNSWRRAQGLAPLSRSGQLQRAAQVHSDDMARMNKMSHVGSDGSRVGARTRAAGYDYREVAENVAMTPLGIDSAMELWAKSPSHRAAMSRSDLREFGLAQNGRYWTLVMGLRK
ncbi:CAP domain-containing protein [Alloyangia pacifica]|uniref:CAP domain-containing protein n=1 Tax=Alloyangia pacifica TaxID=311180 RepID=UPI001CD6E304|nr:CAP domain-containing protein [Alloyangia pacifica]MCA0994141.1 CAP domain-containing protein [Alloyangia pacifica]